MIRPLEVVRSSLLPSEVPALVFVSTSLAVVGGSGDGVPSSSASWNSGRALGGGFILGRSFLLLHRKAFSSFSTMYERGEQWTSVTVAGFHSMFL